MKQALKTIAVALAAAAAASIGTALGTIASDAIKAHWKAPEPPKPARRKRGKR